MKKKEKKRDKDCPLVFSIFKILEKEFFFFSFLLFKYFFNSKKNSSFFSF